MFCRQSNYLVCVISIGSDLDNRWSPERVTGNVLEVSHRKPNTNYPFHLCSNVKFIPTKCCSILLTQTFDVKATRPFIIIIQIRIHRFASLLTVNEGQKNNMLSNRDKAWTVFYIQFLQSHYSKVWFAPIGYRKDSKTQNSSLATLLFSLNCKRHVFHVPYSKFTMTDMRGILIICIYYTRTKIIFNLPPMYRSQEIQFRLDSEGASFINSCTIWDNQPSICSYERKCRAVFTFVVTFFFTQFYCIVY